MSERLDVLTCLTDNAPDFTVNTAVNYVTLNDNGVHILYPVANLGALNYFQAGDSVMVQSIGYMIPMAFQIWGMQDIGVKDGLPSFSLTAQSSLGIYYFPEITDLFLPFENFDLAVNLFLDCSPITEKFQLRVNFPSSANNCYVSMVNVPAVLNGLTFKVMPYIKVIHTLPLIA